MQPPDIPPEAQSLDLRNLLPESLLAINRAFFEMLAGVDDDAEELQEFRAGPTAKRLDA